MGTNNCIKNLLRYILILQKNSCNIACGNCDSSRPFLYSSNLFDLCNTRVISLYTKTGQLFETTLYTDNQTTSSFFRILDINNNCCKLLILEKRNTNFLSTGQTIKVNISCIGAVKCIKDINIFF